MTHFIFNTTLTRLFWLYVTLSYVFVKYCILSKAVSGKNWRRSSDRGTTADEKHMRLKLCYIVQWNPPDLQHSLPQALWWRISDTKKNYRLLSSYKMWCMRTSDSYNCILYVFEGEGVSLAYKTARQSLYLLFGIGESKKQGTNDMKLDDFGIKNHIDSLYTYLLHLRCNSV